MGKRQHTVPQTYLRGFADPKGRLRAFDCLGHKELPVNAKDATVVNSIYDLTIPVAGLDSQFIERFLADKESRAASVLDAIRSGRSGVEQAHRQPLIDFIALQITRTSRVWEEVNELGDWYGKVWFEGTTPEGVQERYREVGIEPTNEQIDQILDFANNLDDYRFVPPKDSFLLMFLSAYLRVLPVLTDGWNWVVVKTKDPFLISDNPVVLVGDSVDGGLGVGNAQEIWLPVGRHHAVVLTKDHPLPPVIFDIPALHAKRVCQRIVLESNRWIFWHPKDEPLRGLETPPAGPRLSIETVGWREREDGTVGELVRVGSHRPVISGERLLNGRPVVNQHGILAPPWKPYKDQRPFWRFLQEKIVTKERSGETR